MRKSGTLQLRNQGGANDLVFGHMGSGPSRNNGFAGIKPMRRKPRRREQFSPQGGQNDGMRGESRYPFNVFAEDAGGKKLQRLKTLIIKSLSNLIDASR
jgi:hypothetical protein